MAHFAEIDSGNTVTRVIVINNDVLLDENGIEREELGIALCKQLYGEDTNWVQTSYNRTFRRAFAGRGMIYEPKYDAFMTTQPYPSWTLNEETLGWEPPIPMPERIAREKYIWDEPTLSWIAVGG